MALKFDNLANFFSCFVEFLKEQPLWPASYVIIIIVDLNLEVWLQIAKLNWSQFSYYNYVNFL